MVESLLQKKRRCSRVIDFETYHEVRRLQRELNLTASQISTKSGLNIKTIRKMAGQSSV